MNVKINYLEEKLHQLESNEKKQVEKLTEKISALDEFDTNSTLVSFSKYPKIFFLTFLKYLFHENYFTQFYFYFFSLYFE